LSYRFHHGNDEDGVAMTVRVADIPNLPEWLGQWRNRSGATSRPLLDAAFHFAGGASPRGVALSSCLVLRAIAAAGRAVGMGGNLSEVASSWHENHGHHRCNQNEYSEHAE
jgi:hypothetical protein